MKLLRPADLFGPSQRKSQELGGFSAKFSETFRGQSSGRERKDMIGRRAGAQAKEFSDHSDAELWRSSGSHCWEESFL